MGGAGVAAFFLPTFLLLLGTLKSVTPTWRDCLGNELVRCKEAWSGAHSPPIVRAVRAHACWLRLRPLGASCVIVHGGGGGIFFFKYRGLDNYGLNECSQSESVKKAKATSRSANYPEEERKHKWTTGGCNVAEKRRPRPQPLTEPYVWSRSAHVGVRAHQRRCLLQFLTLKSCQLPVWGIFPPKCHRCC